MTIEESVAAATDEIVERWYRSIDEDLSTPELTILLRGILTRHFAGLESKKHEPNDAFDDAFDYGDCK